jgi:hypothetical protein
MPKDDIHLLFWANWWEPRCYHKNNQAKALLMILAADTVQCHATVAGRGKKK